jgi:Family of unknown function (DUF5999)
MVITRITRRQEDGSAFARRCPHTPACPAATEPGRLSAVIVAAHPEQGWHLLCNGIAVFDDTGYLLVLNGPPLDSAEGPVVSPARPYS